jgi:hypothetical protein
MTPTMRIDTVSSRQAALAALDPMVRAELACAVRHWALTGAVAVELTAYDQVYRCTPDIGGHWTLFATRLGGRCHEVTALSVSVEFEDERPVDLRVNGVYEVVAGGCTAPALHEALLECGGPLRQVTPLSLSLLSAAGPAESCSRLAASVR